jgi:hypothetical protein
VLEKLHTESLCQPTSPSPSFPPRHQNHSQTNSLQNDVNAEKAKREEAQRAREELQGQVAELGGLVKSGERMLQLEKDQVQKLRDEREAAAREAAVLRLDLEAARADRCVEGGAVEGEEEKGGRGFEVFLFCLAFGAHYA